MKDLESNVNKDLIIQERLALQRTTLANPTIVLAFLITVLYFLGTGLSILGLLRMENSINLEVTFFALAITIFVFGIINFIKHKKRILQSVQHIGDYKLNYF